MELIETIVTYKYGNNHSYEKMRISNYIMRKICWGVVKMIVKKTYIINCNMIGTSPPPKCCVKSTVYGTCSTILTYNIEITMLEIEIIHESYLASSINYSVVLSTFGKIVMVICIFMENAYIHIYG